MLKRSVRPHASEGCLVYIYRVFVNVLLVHGFDAVLEQFRILDVTDTVVQVGLEAMNHRFHLACLHRPHRKLLQPDWCIT